MDTNLYWVLRGTYAERKQKLSEATREFLEASILDREYNDFLTRHADYRDGEEEQPDHGGKRLPYIGWYWRHIQFSDPINVPIGNCGFIGFMVKNKWDYPERCLTIEEHANVMRIIDEAMRLNQQGGEVNKIIAETNAKLDELWGYMQTLTI